MQLLASRGFVIAWLVVVAAVWGSQLAAQDVQGDFIGASLDEVISAIGPPDVVWDTLGVNGQRLEGQTQIIYGHPEGNNVRLTTWEDRVSLITWLHYPSRTASEGLLTFKKRVSELIEQRGPPDGHDEVESHSYRWDRADGGQDLIMLWDDYERGFFSTLEVSCSPIGCSQFVEMLKDKATALYQWAN